MMSRLMDRGGGMNAVERRRRLEALFAQHAGAVRAYAARRVPAAEADDVTSDVFVVVWRRLEHVPDDALPWLLACARKVVANRRRSTRRQAALRARLSRERAGTPTPVIGESVLGEALASLSAADREVLMLVSWEGLDATGAAVVVGCSPRAFAMRLHRARRRLAKAMGELDREARDQMEAVR
jgi:RNA polymerase sigma factor (sigma-70 family)